MFLRVRDICIGENGAVLTLAGIVADGTAWTVGNRRMIAHSFRPFMRGVGWDGHVFRVPRKVFRLVGENLAFFVISINQTASRSAGSAPQPLAADMCVPMGARWDRLGKTDVLICIVGDYK